LSSPVSNYYLINLTAELILNKKVYQWRSKDVNVKENSRAADKCSKTAPGIFYGFEMFFKGDLYKSPHLCAKNLSSSLLSCRE
jgi:hypothetical protein